MLVKKIIIENKIIKVIIDDQEIKLEPSVYASSKLKKDDVLTTKAFHELKRKNKEAFISRKGLKYLANIKSVWEFKNYLKTLQADEDLIAKLTSEYKTKGYLNDTYYAKSIITKYQNKYAKKRISSILIDKRIHSDLIEELLADFSDSNLDKSLINDCHNIFSINYQQAVKTLVRKYNNLGYNTDQIKAVIDLHLDKNRFNEEKTINKYYHQALMKYQNKYEGYNLYLKLKKTLYNQGFNLKQIEKILQGASDEKN